MFGRKVCAAVAVATVVFASTLASTSDPAEARSCRARISGAGVGYGVAGLGTQNARSAALASWSSRVAARYGRRFADSAKASGLRYDCRAAAILQAKCVVSARPCR